MNVKSCKNYITRSWFVIDHMIFEGKNPKKILKNEDYKKYIEIKKDLLSSASDIYFNWGLDYECGNVSVKQLKEDVVNFSKVAGNVALEILNTKSGKKHLIKQVENIKSKVLFENDEKISKVVVERSLYSYTLDSLLLTFPLSSCNGVKIEKKSGSAASIAQENAESNYHFFKKELLDFIMKERYVDVL